MYKEHDDVKLRDGREATLVAGPKNGLFIAEVDDEEGEPLFLDIHLSDIAKLMYRPE